jgi:hypothetical protein
MKYSVQLEGFDGHEIAVYIPNVFSSPRLIFDGSQIRKEKQTRCMLLQRNDGTQAQVKWKQKALGLDVPSLDVDGREIQVAPPLPWYIWIWSALPIILLFLGGALGGLIGAVGVVANISIFRSPLSMPLRLLATVGVTGLCFLVFFLFAVMLNAALSR